MVTTETKNEHILLFSCQCAVVSRRLRRFSRLTKFLLDEKQIIDSNGKLYRVLVDSLGARVLYTVANPARGLLKRERRSLPAPPPCCSFGEIKQHRVNEVTTDTITNIF